MNQLLLEAPAPAAVNGHTPDGDAFTLTASDITRTNVATGRFQRTAPASAVAQALAVHMRLPQSTPWALRDSRRGHFLDDTQPIGAQVDDGAEVDLVPKAHLGGRVR
jgi:hypothetical protein